MHHRCPAGWNSARFVVHKVACRRIISLGGLPDQRCRITSAVIRGPTTSVAMPMPDRDRTGLDIQLRTTSAKIRMDIHWGNGTA
jgi:hypothetical protein